MGGYGPGTLVEQAVLYTWQHLLPAVGFDAADQVAGVEWWTHVREPQGKMHMHFDRDESAW